MGVSIRKVAVVWAIAAAIVYVADLMPHALHGLTNGDGRPLGIDFVNFWSGAFLAWHGRAADIYNWAVYHAFHQVAVGADIAPYIYSYPPTLLALTAPLAMLPYVPAFVLWQAGSWFSFFRALRLTLPTNDARLFALATPAVFMNACSGQNGNWTAAFLGGGLCLLDRRPVIAGVLFGLLTYKPHLGLLIPVALLAGRQWRALAAAAATTGGLVAISISLFGPDLWSDYFRHMTLLRYIAMEDGTGVWYRTISVFMFLRRLGVDVQTTYAVQGALVLVTAVIVAFAWLRDFPVPIRNVLLVLGTFVATPYLQDYDMVIGAFLVVWLMRTEPVGMLKQAPVIASSFILVLPFVASLLAHATGQLVATPFLIAAFALAVAIAFQERARSAATSPLGEKASA
jgi:hypothetical protein